MYYDIVKDKYLENCKVKLMTKTLIAATWKVNSITQTLNYEITGNLGKIVLVKPVSLKQELEELRKNGNSK